MVLPPSITGRFEICAGYPQTAWPAGRTTSAAAASLLRRKRPRPAPGATSESATSSTSLDGVVDHSIKVCPASQTGGGDGGREREREQRPARKGMIILNSHQEWHPLPPINECHSGPARMLLKRIIRINSPRVSDGEASHEALERLAGGCAQALIDRWRSRSTRLLPELDHLPLQALGRRSGAARV